MADGELRGAAQTGRRLVVGVTVGASAHSLLRGQLRWLADNGWDVCLASSPDELSITAAQREGVQLCPIPMRREISPIADIRGLTRWVRLLRQLRPDVINVSTPKAGLLGTTAAWLLRIPRRVYTVRGLRLEGAGAPLSWLLWLLERLTAALATDVIAVSDSLAQELLRRRLTTPEKTWMIGSGSSNGVDYHGIRNRISSTDRQRLRATLEIPPHVLVVGYIGRITYDKGVDTLIRTFGHLRDSSTVLLTIGEAESPEMGAELRSLGCTVRSIDWTDDLWGYLPIIDLLCLPTRREGFPNVVLEAAVAGIPTITTRATGAIDAVVDGETGFIVDVDDDLAIADLIRKLTHDPEKLRRLGAAAQERTLTEYNQERIWSGIAEVISGAELPRFARRLQE